MKGATIRFQFRGKSAKDVDVTVEDRTLARLVRRCQHLPGQCLFEYETDEGVIRTIGSVDVNDYLSRHGATGATAKTFRTWEGSTLAAEGLSLRATGEDEPDVSTVRDVVSEVAARLNNTSAVCRGELHPSDGRRPLHGRVAADVVVASCIAVAPEAWGERETLAQALEVVTVTYSQPTSREPGL